MTKIAFIGAGSTVFMKNLIGDALQMPALAGSVISLMDIDARRLAESELVARKLIASLGVAATVETHTDQRRAIAGADFVIVAFQIGGYKPCTVTDFDVPKKYGLRQTIADTLGIGGIMRGLRTVPHLWKLAEDMRAVCPDAIMLQYVNPMAINTWAIGARFADIKQVGLCHSVQGTAYELSRDLDIPLETIRYRAAGINHMAFYLNFEALQPDGSYRDLYPALHAGYAKGAIPKPSHWNARCPNKVRYEVMTHLGHFVTESSEHFAEYVPWFIPQLPPGAAVEVPVLVDANGLQPTCVNDIPPHLIALMRTNVNVQELTVQALLDENRDHIYHAAYLDPHTAAELDLRQIRALVDDLIAAHGDWLPSWITGKKAA